MKPPVVATFLAMEARHDTRTPGELSVRAGVLIYNVLAALLLAFAGAGLSWPRR